MWEWMEDEEREEEEEEDEDAIEQKCVKDMGETQEGE